MKSGLLANIIQNDLISEDEVLLKVKTWVTNNPRVSLNGPSIKEQVQNPMLCSPLHAAAKRGFTRVLKFLIEEANLSADPNRADMGNQTALSYAIFGQKIGAAVYLASKTSNYPKDTEIGYTALHYAAARNQHTVVKAILAQCPDIINVTSKTGLTALHLATDNNAFECIQLLVEAKADLSIKTFQNVTAYEMSLEKGNGAIISYFLDSSHIFSAIEVDICGTKHSTFNITGGKIPAIITLLEAGAGLDLDRIPQITYDLLKRLGQERTADWQLLVVANHKISPEQTKKVFIKTLPELLERLDDPNYHFKLKQLFDSAQHPALKLLPHVESIAAKIKSLNPQLSNSLASLQQNFSVSSSSVSSSLHSTVFLEKSKKLTKQEALMRFWSLSNEFVTLSGQIDRQFQFIFLKLKDESFQDPHELDVNQIITAYLERFSELLSFSHQKKMTKPEVFDQAKSEFSKIYSNLLVLILTPKFQQYTLNIMIPLGTQLREIIHYHARPLRQKVPGLYNMLLDSLAVASFETAQRYIKSEEFDLAYTLIQEAMYINSKIIIDNFSLKRNVECFNSQCLIAFSKINIHENRFAVSMIQLEHALLLGPADVALQCFYSETLALLIEKYSNIPKQRAFNLLKNSIEYLSSLKQDNENTFHGQVVFKERSYIPKFKELLLKFEERKEENGLLEKLSDVTQKLELMAHESKEPVKYDSAVLLSSSHDVFMPSSICSSSSSSSSSFSCASSNSILTRKTKIKTRGQPKPELDTKRKPFYHAPVAEVEHEHTGFVVPEGYIQPIKISQNNHLFMTMPAKDARFSKFYRLIEGNTIKWIAEKGVNQQGIKLGHVEVQEEPCAPRKQVPIGRLKLCGGETLRAWGYIEQTSKDVAGAFQKLYVFRPEGLTTKENENRSRYKPKGYAALW